ncbi:hypothetical protein F0562_019407 [Nyssa sinensis]|uniref:BHLH domain-containing protein n=1 Tax=Nyssa sinensis TaxID=561372 RepID=A0A5J4ZFC3_9ASTE|nr:hypothetical protein F0562_019407 [Nyssa sinensis]
MKFGGEKSPSNEFPFIHCPSFSSNLHKYIYFFLQLFGKEHLDVESSERQRDALVFSYGSFVNKESLSFEEEEQQQQQQPPSEYLTTPSLEEDKMPFLQMLQSAGSPPFSPFLEPSFKVLLRLQHQRRPWDRSHNHMAAEMKPSSNRTIRALEPESCVTHEVLEMQSPAKSETEGYHHQCIDVGVSCGCNQLEQPTYEENCCREGIKSGNRAQRKARGESACVSPALNNRVRRKRKRMRAAKNKEEVESQRMTHIAVERNRRRQMNDHLSALRDLMPSSYVQRSDQASIIGGAIDFVKELEQLLQSLQSQKKMRKGDAAFTLSPPAEAEAEATVIQNHVNLKIKCDRRPGQLLKTIVALEDLSLTVLHLNIISLETSGSVHYSFNLKIEDDCKVGSADEIVGAVHQIFS